MNKVTVGVNGMNCMNCVGKVKKAVEALPGTDSVSVDLKGKSMTLNLDSHVTDLETVKKTVTELGFGVTDKKPAGLLGKLLKR